MSNQPKPVRRLSKPTKPVAPVARKVQPVVVFDSDEDEDLDEDEDFSENGADEDEVSEEVFTSKERVTRRMPVPTPSKAKNVGVPVVRKQVATRDAEFREAVAEEVQNLSDDPVPGILSRLRDGESILIEKVGTHFRVSYGNTVATAVAQQAIESLPTKGRINQRGFEDEILSDAYKAWQIDWQKLSTEQKFAQIRAAKVKWDEHTDPMTNLMRAVTAYQAHLGIEKYKEQYKTQAQRKAARKEFTS